MPVFPCYNSQVAKKKPVKRKVKRVVKKKSSSILTAAKVLAVLIGALLLFGFFNSFSKNQTNLRKSERAMIRVKNATSSADLLKEKENPITPSPTPAPLIGYCLNVPVLMYHHIQPEGTAKQLGQTALTVDNGVFDQQMQYLAQNGYTTFFANDFINALISHTQLPAKSVVITIDDGYEDNYIYALPVLQKYGLKANIMLATGLMGNSNMLSWDEVKSLKNSGLIYFTNHTWSHYPISKGPQAKIEYEIDTAKAEIEQNTGQMVNVFTYPYGSFNNNAIATLQKKGYIGAFSEIPGTYQCDSFLETLHRTRIGNGSLSSYGI